jgi:hypothetical protein
MKEEHISPKAININNNIMSSATSNAKLYEIIGKLTVQTQSLESDISALRAELSENAAYTASLERSLEEFFRNPPSANARPRWGTERPKLSHRCNRPEAYPCYERSTTESEVPPLVGSTIETATGSLPWFPRHTGYPIRAVANNCSSCGLSLVYQRHDNCQLEKPTWAPLERQVADSRWHNDSLFENRENDFEKYAEHDTEIEEETIVQPPLQRQTREQGLTLSDLAVPSHIVDGMRLR